MPLASIGGGTAGASLYGWVDPLTKREYALMGRTNGTAIVDITNPRAPKYVANIPSAGSNTTWREPKVYQNTVYIGVDGGTHRMQYADLTQVRNYTGTTLTLNSATFNGQYQNSTGSLVFVNNIHTIQVNKDSGYLYLSGTSLNSGAPLMVNVNNPNTPVAAGAVTNSDGYSHEAQVVTYHGPDATYQGREIMLTSNGKQGATSDTFSIVDVTNKASTQRLSTKTYANAGYAHQGWLTEDHRYFFMNDELDETGGLTDGKTRTHLWDVADLNNPVYRGFRDLPTSSVDHNMYVKDGFLFETNYTTGLRMFKIGDLASTNSADWLTEVAYYDTYAPNDNATFNGAWNNYPYFPSGNIAISDINGGLFVVQPNVSGWALNPWDPRGGGNGGLPSQSPEPTSVAALIGAGLVGMSRRRR
ncbi:MAG: choice-of-anchor B family protein [Anaerolineae bacterium]|nr:choice-of-anchor B family protein [Phycisphaerae bacterium]